MGYTIDELRTAVAELTEPRTWGAAASLVANERKKVEAFVADGGQAYGFTTLFGHLDSIRREEEGRTNLYRGHLIGHPEAISPDEARGIVSVKLCQLSLGGSGISPESYARLRDAFVSDLQRVQVDLRASYGSGDVVPGTWLVRSIFPGPDSLKRGDLMALINGAYIPAGVLLGHYGSIEEALNRATCLVSRARDLSVTRRESDHVQLPVSLRDVQPLRDAIDSALKSMQTAITRSANRQSANPLFLFSDGKTHPVSNSSFLDFKFSLDVAAIHETVRIAGAYVVAATRWVSGLAEVIVDDLERPLYVQLPKVCKAYEDQFTSSTASAAYSQTESRGVEDISDSSLRRVLDLTQAVDILDRMSNLLSDELEKLKPQ